MPYELDGPNDLYGVFNEERSVFIGDPYAKDTYKLSRHKGKGFAVPFQPKGTGPDAMIDKTTKLTLAGDTYVEPLAALKEPKVTSIHPKAFVPVGGTKKPSGAGSLYGLIGPGVALLDTDASVAAAGPRKKDPVEKKRSIYVTPAKQGTFGFPWQDRSIGGTRFDFIPDEYCRGRILERELKREARAKINKPFVSTGRTGRGIVAIPYTASSGPDRQTGQRLTVRLEDIQAVTAQVGHQNPVVHVAHVNCRKDTSSSKESAGRKPWKQSSPPPQGRGYGCISTIPYVPCPTTSTQRHDGTSLKPFKTAGASHERLSMWAPSPYAYAARPPPDNDFTLLG